MLDILIQHQYSVLNGFIQKRQSTVSYKQLTREFTRYRGGPKYLITKRSKISLNINQLIKSSLDVSNRRLFMAMSHSIWQSAEGVFSQPIYNTSVSDVVFRKLMADLSVPFGFYYSDSFDRVVALFNNQI